MDKRDVLKGLENVMHPAINFSLIDLGIIKDINIEDENAKVIFAVPFKNNPIVHNLVSLISQPIMNLGLSFDYETVVMTEEEKENYFKLEKIGWKELD